MIRTISVSALVLVVLLAALPAPAQQGWQGAVVEWAPDGKVLISANGLLARFDLASAEEELLDDAALAFALSPDGRRIALARPTQVELHGYPELARQAVLTPATPVTIDSLAWSPDAATLAAGTRAGHILLWEVESGEQWGDLGVEPASPVVRLQFSADSRRLLSAFEDGRAVLWDLEQRRMLRRFDWPRTAGGAPDPAAQARVVALSPDGRRVLASRVGGEEAEVVLFDDAGGILWRRSGYGVGFTRDGAGVLTLAAPFRIAALYRAADAEALRTFEPPEGVNILYLVRLNREGNKLLGVGEDYAGLVMVVWDFATAQVLRVRR
ncbi:MAG: WD40 repeat domain-containing protein [Terriglobia bacterium]